MCTNWVHFICALRDWFRAPIIDVSMETITQECKMQELTNFMPKDQEPIIKAPMEDPTQESMIQESTIQVSMIQESKMQAPTILMVLESNEVLSIQEYSKVQRINETLKIEEPLKAKEFEQKLKIYKEGTFIYIGPLVKEKCMNMAIKISLRYWSIGRFPLVKVTTTTIPCGQDFLKGWKMIRIPNYVIFLVISL